MVWGWIWALFFFRSTPDDSNEYSVLRTLIQLKEKCYYFEGFQAKTGREQCIPQCPVPNFRGSLQIWMQHTFAYVCGSRAFGGWLLVLPLLKKKKNHVKSYHCETSENWGIKLLEREKRSWKITRMKTSLDFSLEPQMLDDRTMLPKF